MTDLTPPSGAKVEIKLASFTQAIALKNAITGELSKASIDFKLSNDLDIEKLLPAIMAVDSSETVQAALFACLGRCLYNGEKITDKTFEPEAAREDYYVVVIECLKANLSPFFKSLLSKLSESGLLAKAEPQK